MNIPIGGLKTADKWKPMEHVQADGRRASHEYTDGGNILERVFSADRGANMYPDPHELCGSHFFFVERTSRYMDGK